MMRHQRARLAPVPTIRRATPSATIVGGRGLRAGVAANIGRGMRGHDQRRDALFGRLVSAVLPEGDQTGRPGVDVGERQHARGPALEFVGIEARRKIVPGNAEQRPQRLALPHQQMDAADRTVRLGRDDAQRPGSDGCTHGIQASMAALSASRMS